MRTMFRVLFLLIACSLTGCGAVMEKPEDESTSDSTGEPGSLNQELNNPSPVTIKPADLNVFQNGSYNAFGYLNWGNFLPWYYGGSSLSAQYKMAYFNKRMPDGSLIVATQVNDPNNGYWGECVSLAKSLASRYMTNTANWKIGQNVMAVRNVPVGTVIASFRNGSQYAQVAPYDHTAIFAGYTGNGIMVFDQNYSLDGLVKKHEIVKTSGSGPGNAAAFYVVLVP